MEAPVITKHKIDIDPKILADLQTKVDEQGQVVLHFKYETMPFFGEVAIRIWQTSYLYALDSTHRSSLVHAENICYYPNWQILEPGTTNYFTLLFSGLPKSCSKFDFLEECKPEGGAFEVRNIIRNDSDVYFFEIN